MADDENTSEDSNLEEFGLEVLEQRIVLSGDVSLDHSQETVPEEIVQAVSGGQTAVVADASIGNPQLISVPT